MRRQLWLWSLVLTLGCGEDPIAPGIDNIDPDEEEKNAESFFSRAVLDPAETSESPISMAIAPDGRVGVAYFLRLGEKDYELRYVEWDEGTTSPSELVAKVALTYGLSLAYDSTGKAAVSYLGGESTVDETLFWRQSDVAISYRNGPNSWTEHIAVTLSNQAPAPVGNDVSNNGTVVGVFSQLVFQGTQAFIAYRDVHDGQYPQQDWAGSDLELAVGGPSSWTHEMVIAGGKDKQAYGGHISMVLANGQPALVHDQVFGSADGSGQNVLFHRRTGTNAWTPPAISARVQTVRNTQLGASLVWDSALGYAYAVTDRSEDKLTFVRSSDGSTWTQPDPVYQAGTGGWYPSLAVDPATHDPSIVFYVCSAVAGVTESGCPAREDELRMATRIGGDWREELVDAAGGYSPKLGFLPSGKRVVAYRHPFTGVLKIAVEE